MLTAGTNVRVWDIAVRPHGFRAARAVLCPGNLLLPPESRTFCRVVQSGKNSHVIAMKQFTKVDCMVVQNSSMGEVLWCGHSDGQVTCTHLRTVPSEPVVTPIFNFSPHKSG